MEPQFRIGPPYIWTSWLTRLLAGDDVCWWAPWYKARFKFDKVEREGFDLAKWSAEHTALLDQAVAKLRLTGYTEIRRENENKFLLKGEHALLSGKPDIVAFKDNEILIVDAKSGAQKNADWWQVLVYLFAFPLAFRSECHGKTITGMVAYQPTPDTAKWPRMVPVGDLTPDRRAEIVKAIQGLGRTGTRPTPKPSGHECSRCDIPASICTVRNGDGAAVSVLTSEF